MAAQRKASFWQIKPPPTFDMYKVYADVQAVELNPEYLEAVIKAGAGIAASAVTASVIAASSKPTPANPEGPFYPRRVRVDRDTDLTLIDGHRKRAEGQVIRVTGEVLDQDGQPVEVAFADPPDLVNILGAAAASGLAIAVLPIVEELPEGLKEEIQRLNARLRRMGGVNPNAPEDYTEVQERHQFRCRRKLA